VPLIFPIIFGMLPESFRSSPGSRFGKEKASAGKTEAYQIGKKYRY
jgi:hypothetical protein